MSNTHEMQKQIDALVMRLGSQGRVVIWTGAGIINQNTAAVTEFA